MEDNDYSDINISRELRERELMLESGTTKRTLNSRRKRVWPIDASKTDWTAENAHRVADEEDDDEGKPEGLR
jgi:hypothetical protein